MALLPVDEAIVRLLAAADVMARAPAECLMLAEAAGRVLAEDVVATMPVPPEDNSAMDGIAIRQSDLLGVGPWRLLLSQRIPAGREPQPLQPGTAARLFTGAVIPAGADAVVMQENCRFEADAVWIDVAPHVGENIRRAGQDIPAGSVAVSAGSRLDPARLGLVASTGQAVVMVWPRLRVALLCTGDELVDPGQPLVSGQLYNSNRIMLAALLVSLGCEVIDLGRVADTLPATREALRRAVASGAEVVLSSGGVSVGEEDHVRAAVEAEGHLDLWKLAIKPGKPVAFGGLGVAAFLGLPGNPQSVWVTFQIVARPFLRRLLGEREVLPRPVLLPAGFVRTKPQGRREYLRVRYEMNGAGGCLRPHGNQSSGALMSAAWADGLALVEAGQVVEEGDLLPFIATFCG